MVVESTRLHLIGSSCWELLVNSPPETILSVLPICLSMWDPCLHEAEHKSLPHSTVSTISVCPPHSPHTQTYISVTHSIHVTPLPAEEIAAPSVPGGHPGMGHSYFVPLKLFYSLSPGGHQDGHPYFVALEQFFSLPGVGDLVVSLSSYPVSISVTHTVRVTHVSHVTRG